MVLAWRRDGCWHLPTGRLRGKIGDRQPPAGSSPAAIVAATAFKHAFDAQYAGGEALAAGAKR